ncbi:hypothetical protein [Streptomyces sp. E2N166]|nr:hypothetical protein [Streptomyces sp. E2N166]
MTRTPHTTDAARSRPTTAHPAAAPGTARLEPTQEDITATGSAPTPLDRT